MYSFPSFLLPFIMAGSTTLSLKSVRVAHPLCHLRFLACMRHRVRVYLRMRCTTVHDNTHTGEVSLSVRLILRKIRNILSIRCTLDISRKNRCCNCDLYSGKYSSYFISIQNSHRLTAIIFIIAQLLCPWGLLIARLLTQVAGAKPHRTNQISSSCPHDRLWRTLRVCKSHGTW